jgi:hypothetical protein
VVPKHLSAIPDRQAGPHRLSQTVIAGLYVIENMIKREPAQSEATMTAEDQYRLIAARREGLAACVLTEFRK